MAVQKTYIDIFLVYLLLFTSGSQLGMESPNKTVVLVFFIAALAWFFLTDRKINENFILYLTIFAGSLFLLSLYTGGSLSLQSAISTTMRLLLAYLILRTVGHNFKDVFVKLVVFLAAISLFGFLSDNIHLFDGIINKLPKFHNRGHDGLFYVFKDRLWDDRNKSIFFEPGAYQGFLNAALFMIFFTKNDYTSRQKWIYITVLVAALITAFSTTGFVIFALGFSLFLYRSRIISFSGKVVIIGLMLAVVGIFSTEFQSSVVNKLEGYMNPTEGMRGYSAQGRSYDAQTDITLFKRHIFGMGYDKYKEEFQAIYKSIGAESDTKTWGLSSNGVTRTFAQYGLPFALFYFASFYWALRKLLGGGLVANTAFVMYMLFLWGEAYYMMMPIGFAIIAAPFILDQKPAEETVQNDAVQ